MVPMSLDNQGSTVFWLGVYNYLCVQESKFVLVCNQSCLLIQWFLNFCCFFFSFFALITQHDHDISACNNNNSHCQAGKEYPVKGSEVNFN